MLVSKVGLYMTLGYTFYLFGVCVAIGIGTITFGRTLRGLSTDSNIMLELSLLVDDEVVDDIIVTD